jgi:hypothetical protein
MDNNNTIEAQSAAPADAAQTAISASAAGASSAGPANDIPKLDPPQLDPPKASPPPSEIPTVVVAPAATETVAPARANRFALLAAAVALSAAFGALAGALGASGLAQPAPATGSTTTTAVPQDIGAMHAAIEKIRTELAALRTGIEAGTRSANVQFGKVTERFDRVERAQTERAAKLAKTLEAVERLEKRAELAPAKETTGSVPPQPAATAPVQPPQPSVVPGWTVRDVYRGMAIIQGARTGPIEVEAGDTVPFLGRIEAIRRQDGHWVVVTSKGIIAAAR